MTTQTALPDLATGTWTIDPAHSEVGFTVRHLMSKVRGSFTEFEGTIVVAEDLANSSATATIQTGSITTRQEQRDGHLRSGDFLDIDSHPTLTFATTGIRAERDRYVVAGELTIKGNTRPVELDVEFLGVQVDQYGATKAGFEASTTINRKDFGVEANVMLNGDKLMLGENVDITLTIQASLAS